ncbi:cell division protein FtsA [Candidatus Parcubacteria bacterium]|jgi:cell division protein FtsA|nr:cell division protein FtsA [Candidatus Parcubacteria bacterium]
MAKNRDIITGLDVGSSAVRIVMAEKLSDGRLKVIGAAETSSEGVSRGSITSIEAAVSSISETIEKCERMTGLRVDRMVVGMSGIHIKMVNSKGVVAVAKANEQVEYSDIDRALEVAESTTTVPNYEIINVLPISYNLDDQKNIKEPQGMSGVRLEVETQIIMSLSSQVKNLTKCIYRTGVDIDDIVFSILATSEAVLTPKQKELGVAVVDIGSATTSLAIFEEGNILHTAILPIGAGHITNDLAIGLKTSVDVAEAVKKDHAQALAEGISKRDEIDLHKYSEEEKKGSYVFKKDISEISEARMEEVFSMVNDELKKIDRDGKLPSGIVLTGGGAKLPLVIDLAKQVFNLPVFMGLPVESNFPIDKLNDPEYTTALGLVIWGDKNIDEGGSFFNNITAVKQSTDKMRSWFRSLWPSS